MSGNLLDGCSVSAVLCMLIPAMNSTGGCPATIISPRS